MIVGARKTFLGKENTTTRIVIATTSTNKAFTIYSAKRKDTSQPIVVEWGDGTVETVDANLSNRSHTYELGKKYTIRLYNIMSVALNNNGDVKNWTQLVSSAYISDEVTAFDAYSFSYCNNMTHIRLPAGTTAIPTGMFRFCRKLGAVKIPKTVTSIGENSFYYCMDISSIILPDSLTTIGNNAFEYCGFTSITIPANVTSIGTASFSCPNLTDIYVDENNQNYTSKNRMLLTKDEKELVAGVSGNVIIPSGVTKIRNWAFYSIRLTSVSIPNSVTSIGNYAFRACTLTSITIPNSVTSIGDFAFYNCSGLSSVTIPSSVTSIGNSTFYYCNVLTSVTIPASVTSIKDYAFSNCPALTSVTIPDSVTSIGNYAFRNCRSIKSVTLGSGVTSIGTSIFTKAVALSSITCNATTAPTLGTNVFGIAAVDYTGRNTYSAGTNRLKVPAGATGYDTGQWLDPLCDSTKCGFTLEYTNN